MDQRDQEAEPHFSLPVRQTVWMLIVIGLVTTGGYLAYASIAPVFWANPWLNGFIVFVFIIGLFMCFSQVAAMIRSVRWIKAFAADASSEAAQSPPNLLAPLASLLRSRGARSQLSASSSRSILDSVGSRIDEEREITRYIVNTLIFLGLLGTFYGLATTVPALVETIRSLAPAEGEDGTQVFSRLMSGLEDQLDGMGVAFASSLLGLAGSLVVGLLELFAGQSQNRFYRELEEWLSTITRVGFASGDGELGGDQVVVGGIVDHLGEQMEALQVMFTQSDIAREETNDRLAALVSEVSALTQRIDGQTGYGNLAEIMARHNQLLEKMEGDGVDAESRMRLRSMDVQLLRILEEMTAGRQESIAELRSELKTLTRAIKALQPSDQG